MTIHSMEGILLVDKAKGSSAFQIVSLLRRLTKIQKIGHAGTLDPFATGVMVMLIGRPYTQKSDQFLNADKQYRATLRLGIATDSYDVDGKVVSESPIVPSLEEIMRCIASFQGTLLQIPPMFSAKKVDGKKLYQLARKGISIERKAVSVHLHIAFLRYQYPELELLVDCSKGTYIRSLAHDMGQSLGCGAHLNQLARTRSGVFSIGECVAQGLLTNSQFDIGPFLRKSL